MISSHDDSFGDADGIGIYQDLRVAQMVNDRGLFDFYPIVGCHFAGTPLPDPRSGVCYGYGKIPVDLVSKLKKLGIIIVSHSFSHVSHPDMTPSAMLGEMRLMQDLLEPYENDIGIYAYRCPGLNCGKREADLVNSARDLAAHLKGPLNADVGGYFILSDGTPVGGDWWFYANHRPAQEACGYYTQWIRYWIRQHGLIMLLHVRTEVMTGRDGDKNFPTDLFGCIVDTLAQPDTQFDGPRVIYGPLDAVEGFLGNVQAGPATQITTEFGSSDGYGKVLFGDANHDGFADAFKARDGGVFVLTSDGRQFSPSTVFPQVPIADPDWPATFNHKFWVADLRGTGRADVIYPTSAGLMYASAVGNGSVVSYGPAQLLTTYFNGWDPSLLDSIAFGDLNHDGLLDIVAWAPNGIIQLINDGKGNYILSPTVISFFSVAGGWQDPKYRTTLQVRDIDGDGFADVCMRGIGDYYCAINNRRGGFYWPMSWSKKFSDSQGWDDPAQYGSLALAKINGKIGVAGGTIYGVVFQEPDPGECGFLLHRVLNNTDFSTLPNWKPERAAAQLAFADTQGTGNEDPVLQRADGLYRLPVQNVRH